MNDEGTQEVEAVGIDLVAAVVSAVPVVGGVIAGLIEAAEDRSRRRVIRMIQKSIEDHGLRLQDLEEAVEREDIAEVIDHSVRVAIDSRAEEKLDVLASIVAAGVLPGAQVEMSHLLLNLLATLEGVHIQVLMLIGLPRPGGGQLRGKLVVGMEIGQIRRCRPDLAEVVGPVVAHLESQGLVRDVTGVAFRDARQLAPTELGTWFLRELENRSIHASDSFAT